MIEIRTPAAHELDGFAAVGLPENAAGDGAGGAEFARQLRSMLQAGTTRLDWCFFALVEGEPLARVAFAADAPAADERMEMYLFGLALDWARPAARDAARALLEHSLPIVARVGPAIDARSNPEVHPDAESRRRLFEEVGFGLFQEKDGHYWQPSAAPVGGSQGSRGPRGSRGPLGSRGPRGSQRTPRLTFRSLAQVSRDEFVAVLARGPAGTLDRNDRFFYELTGPVGWATIMMGAAQPGDEASWKLAYNADNAPVGYVMLSPFDGDDTATIVHIGVVPEQRGRGYINDLLAEANADAEARGFAAILSDVDVLNVPMRAAMERAGHRSGVRPWHVRHYRYPPPP